MKRKKKISQAAQANKRRIAAMKAAETRKRRLAARRAAETRRRRRRSQAAYLGWETRRRRQRAELIEKRLRYFPELMAEAVAVDEAVAYRPHDVTVDFHTNLLSVFDYIEMAHESANIRGNFFGYEFSGGKADFTLLKHDIRSHVEDYYTEYTGADPDESPPLVFMPVFRVESLVDTAVGLPVYIRVVGEADFESPE